MTKSIIFAALDDWLLSTEIQNDVLPAIHRIIAAQQPLIWVTQRSGAEVVDFNTTLGHPLPCIAEGGSVLYLPQSSNPSSNSSASPSSSNIPMPLDSDEVETVGAYWSIALAGPYVQARAGLRVLANELHHSLLGYGDMTIDRLQKFTGLSAAATQRAKARESSEPFITPKAVTAEALNTAAETLGFNVVYGERVSYLLAEGVSLNEAITQMRSRYPSETQPATAGLGQWPLDQALLSTVDTAIALTPSAPESTSEFPPAVQTMPSTPENWATALLTLAGLEAGET